MTSPAQLAPAAPAPSIDVAGALARLGVPVRRITSDSRSVLPGDAFAAYPGESRDGRAFIADALRRGAGSVVWDNEAFQWAPEWNAPNVGVGDLKHQLGYIADHIYDHPSSRLWVVGVTGTNGKTSCAHWIARALTALGRNAAIAGTLGNGLYGTVEPAINTTPDAASLHDMMRRWVSAGAQSAAMEVSSHGLVQGRVNGVKFDVALFTNLTRDHLDYHGTMSAYGAAKARLFEWPSLQTAVINAEDPHGRLLINRCSERGVPVLSYGQHTGDVTIRNLKMSVDGIEGTVVTPSGNAQFESQLVGSFNVSNLLGVLAVLLASNVPLDRAIVQIARFEPVAGRMQKVSTDGQPLVVVDYAHTPDALEKVLGALRPVAESRSGKLVVVFGCGGDRDPGKRAQMGAIAGQMADRIIVTSDNPRSEAPEAIIDQIAAGLEASHAAHARIDRITSRDEAIAEAVRSALESDTVLIAGKGHEAYQEIGEVRHPFSDSDHARTALAEWSRR